MTIEVDVLKSIVSKVSNRLDALESKIRDFQVMIEGKWLDEKMMCFFNRRIQVNLRDELRFMVKEKCCVYTCKFCYPANQVSEEVKIVNTNILKCTRCRTLFPWPEELCEEGIENIAVCSDCIKEANDSLEYSRLNVLENK